jgi:putative tryptophan/tyrosine transport system substrate-binding protein
MRRRDLVLLLSGAALGPASRTLAQKPSEPVIGILGVASPGGFAGSLAAFHQGLRGAGYIEGQNVEVEYRWADGRTERLPALAAELVGRKVDVIFTSGGLPAIFAAKDATSTIPIVFETGSDPGERGLVASYARPGGSLTGVTILTAALMPKRLEVLAELVPRARAIGLLFNPKIAFSERVIADVQTAAQEKNLQLHGARASAEPEFEPAFAALMQTRVDALLVGNDPFFFSRREQLVGLAARHRLPAMYEWRDFVTAGGLVSYGTSLTDMYRQAGAYVGRILSGAKPADLPILQPTKFELAINLRTAKLLALIIPQALLQRADEVLE